VSSNEESEQRSQDDLPAPHGRGAQGGASRESRSAVPKPMADLAEDFVFIVDNAGRVQYINVQAAREFGLRPEEAIGRRIDDLFPPVTSGGQAFDLGDAVRSGQPLSFEGKAALADGELWLDMTVVPMAGEAGETGVAIGASRHAGAAGGGEQDLQISQSELSAVFREAPVMMILIDRNRRIRQVNRATVRFARRRAADMVGLPAGEALRCLHSLEHPRGCGFGLFCKSCPLNAALAAAFGARLSHHRVEARLPLERPRQEGECDLLISTIPVRFSGRPMALMCLEDITAPKHTEQALSESQRARSTLMSNLPGMAYRRRNDEFWTMEFASEGCLELTGHQPADLVLNRATSYEELIHPDDREPVRRAVDAALGERRPFEFLYRILTASGEEKWVWEKGRGVFSPDGPLVALEGFVTDITALKRAEEAKEHMQGLLLHAQKMEAIGILAGGIAHDFNNLLTIIDGNAQLAQMAVAEGEPTVAEFLDKTLAAAERGASLVRQLRIFGRKQPIERMSTDINRTIGDLLQMLGRLIGEDITVDAKLSPSLWTVRGDETSLEQVLMNLAVNARDAMPTGGKLKIRTENVVLDEAACASMPEARPGRFVRIVVADTGVGMDAATLQHIFEPFFSTKDPTTSSGLGLAVVYGVVKQHDGWIMVASRPGQGARFAVYLPAAFPEPEEKAREETLLNELRGRGERILLVEDESDVREFALRALRKSGYQVVSAANAREAEAIFAREGGRVDLLLSDVVLPGTSGLDLVDRLRALRPGLRVLLTSGYADERSRWDLISQRGLPYLQKPYSFLSLLRAARDALGEEVGPPSS